MANLNDTIVNGNITATGKIVKSGGTSTQFLMADGSVKEEASIGNGTYVKKTGDTMTGGLVINKSGNEANVPLIVGGDKTTISLSVTSTPGYTSGMVVQAGGGSATNGSYIGFHNPNTSSATIGYKNSNANNGIFRFMSDTPTWSVSIGGSKNLPSPWKKASLLVGDDGFDKAVIGYLTNRMTGLVVGSHNSNLDGWAALNLSGSTVNILNEENTIMTVNASGATLKGTLTINNDIIYKGTNSSSNIIKFIDNTGDQWGNGIAIGGGGPTIIGGGEAADEIRNNVTVSGGAEIMAIGNDGGIDFYTNCQDGFGSAKHITMNTDGTVSASGFNKISSSNDYVLLGGGGHKALSDFAAGENKWKEVSSYSGSSETNSGMYSVAASASNSAHINHSFFINVRNVGTPFQIQIPDSTEDYIYKWTKANGWRKIKSGYADSAGNADTIDNEHASAFAHIAAHNDLTASGNEFTFASSGFSGAIWLNYRTAGGTNGNITEYKLGNGAGGTLGSIIHTGNIGSQSVNYASTAHYLRTFSASNSSHGDDYLLKIRHNVDSNDRFKLQIVRTDGTVTHSTSVDYANSAGSVAWDNISSKPITITQRNNSSPVSGAYAYGTHVTMRNTNNWFEIYAPHTGTSSSRVYMQTGWDNDRQGWKAIAWTSDIPTVNNATLTIQKNGSNVATFTANSNTNTTANITVPTKTSQLTNDSGFITSAPNPTNYYWANVKISSTSSTNTSPTFSSINLGSYAKIGTGTPPRTHMENTPTGGVESNAVWMATTGGGGESAGVLADGGRVVFWAPQDKPMVYMDSDNGTCYEMMHSGNFSSIIKQGQCDYALLEAAGESYSISLADYAGSKISIEVESANNLVSVRSDSSSGWLKYGTSGSYLGYSSNNSYTDIVKYGYRMIIDCSPMGPNYFKVEIFVFDASPNAKRAEGILSSNRDIIIQDLTAQGDSSPLTKIYVYR